MSSTASSSYPGPISAFFSVCSLSCWLIALLPQQYKNYRRKSVAGVSIYWLLVLASGDLMNFLGCVLTKQLPFQLYNSCYGLTNDAVLFLQYWYYGVYCPKKRRIANSRQNASSGNCSGGGSNCGYDDDDDVYPQEMEDSITSFASYGSVNSNGNGSGNGSGNTRGTLLTSSMLLLSQASASTAMPISVLSQKFSNGASTEIANQIINTNNADIPGISIGRTIAYLCAFSYICCRIPQLYTNHKRRSTSGLSPFFVTIVIFANSFYATSILTSSQFTSNGEDKDAKWLFFWNEVPYIVGNVGSVLLDLVFFWQYYKFGDHLNGKNAAQGEGEERDSNEMGEMEEVNETTLLI